MAAGVHSGIGTVLQHLSAHLAKSGNITWRVTVGFGPGCGKVPLRRLDAEVG